MDEADKTRLRKNYKTLLDVKAEEILPHLIQEGIFTLQDREDILAEKKEEDKISKLLRMLPDQGSKAYSVFKDTLMERYDWVVEALNNTQVESTGRKKEPITELNTSALQRVAKNAKVKQCWKQLGHSLGLEESDLIEIEYKCRNEPLGECVYNTLSQWRCRLGRAATIDKLLEALRDCDCSHLADELEGK